jgi:DNA repair protein RecN (Recombination protein N)
MLHELYIKNFAIIDDLRIRFSAGLTILSGETGAGKSIIINAINLLMGNRASSKLIRTGEDIAEIEGLFAIHSASGIAALLKANDFDSSEELIIRRIISRKERHRIYINGRLATIQLLKTITQNMVAIASQHAHQGLLQEEQQLEILDQYAGLHPLRQSLADLYHRLIPMIRHLKKLEVQKTQQIERKELLEYQKKELLEAAPQPGEDDKLEKRRSLLKNAETFHKLISQCITTLYSSDGAIMERLKETQKDLAKAAELDDSLALAKTQVAETIYQLEDVILELQSYANNAMMDPKELETIEDRLYALHRLKKKYGGSLSEVITYLDTIDKEIGVVEKIDSTIAETASQIDTLQTQLGELAISLSLKRKQAAKTLRMKVIEELAQLQMPNTEFQVHFQSEAAAVASSPGHIYRDMNIHDSGIDSLSFLIAPNVGEPPKPLKSIASGGELSRVVLALKIILAETDAVETVIFDEVDAGIGGGVAEIIGQKLSTLAAYHQVICITHLPQIAKFGRHHFKINKKVANGRTLTTISPLNKQLRLKEIARMLGGVNITQATLDHARDLLQKS